MLDLHGRAVVVVGGGPVGLRRAKSLCSAEAKVTLIATELSENPPPQAVIINEPYRSEMLSGAKLVFACTDDSELNTQIAEDARRINALVNVADRADLCDFYMPAIATDGDVVLAVGTGGDAPALASNIKNRLAGELGDKIGSFAALLAELRSELKDSPLAQQQRMEIAQQLSSDETYELFAAEGREAVRQKMQQLIK